VIGLGKIAQDQHLPVIAGSDAFALVAVASQRGIAVPGALPFRDHMDLLRDTPDLDAVAICTPPQARHAIARAALAAGKDVMLEKPPTASLAELSDLAAAAGRLGRVLMTTWHSQYNDAVDAARDRLAGETVTSLFIEWKEDVRKWHPGQAWIWRAGGFGVFDPGINALSIATKILPQPLFIESAELLTPDNAEAPIAAILRFAGSGDLRAEFDWRQSGGEVWQITVGTASGHTLVLAGGGSHLTVDGNEVVAAPAREYQGIYRHFDALLRERRSHVDAGRLTGGVEQRQRRRRSVPAAAATPPAAPAAVEAAVAATISTVAIASVAEAAPPESAEERSAPPPAPVVKAVIGGARVERIAAIRRVVRIGAVSVSHVRAWRIRCAAAKPQRRRQDGAAQPPPM
jgi:D-galactose 1-dehydrogenase